MIPFLVRLLFLPVACCWLLLAGCGKRESAPPAKTNSTAGAAEDFVTTDDTTPVQRAYLAFGREVMVALAGRDYTRFYGQLSPHAVARMSLNQFAPEDDDKAFETNEHKPRLNVTPEQFPELMARMEARYGAPARPLGLHLHSDEAHILAGQPKEEADRIDIMFAIGNMPAMVPVGLRRASLRGSLAVQLSPVQLAAAAKDLGVTPDELAKDAEFKPYCNIKLVLVETPEGLRLGYFEFLPPSMLD